MIQRNTRFASGAELIRQAGPVLTIGIPHCCDYQRLWHTLASLHKDRLAHGLVDLVELLVIDNSLTVQDTELGKRHSDEARKRVSELPNARFETFTERPGTAPTKNEVFRQARGRAVMCLDSHCELPPGVMTWAVNFWTAEQLNDDLHHAMELHLRMVEPDGTPAICCSHRQEAFGRDGNFGICTVSPQAKHARLPFEVGAAGCGCFMARRETWLGFHQDFRGWGGEEGYIQEKYRQAGRKAWVHPEFQYVHQYHAIDGVSYQGRDWVTKAKNALLGFRELRYPKLADIKAAHVQPRRLNEQQWNGLLQELRINETTAATITTPAKTHASLLPGEEQLLAALPCPLRWRTAGQVLCNVGCISRSASLFDCVRYGLVTLSGTRKDLKSCQACEERPGTEVTAAPIELPASEGLRHRRLVVGVLSARGNVAKRQAIRQTWNRLMPSDCELLFLIGDPEKKGARIKGDELWLPVPDGYNSLPHKTKAWCQWLCKYRSFARALKCDDDTYVAIDRLLVTDKKDADYVGAPLGHDSRVASGGAGYLLSPRAVAILARDMQARSSAEDVEAWAALHAHGIQLTPTSRFSAGHAIVPQPGNEQITAHYVTPEKMLEIHNRLKSPQLAWSEE